MPGPTTGRFHPWSSDGFGQTNDAQARAEAHLGMRPIVEDFLHDLGAFRPHVLGPINHAAGSPLQVFLMGFGPMLFQGGGQPWLIAARVGGDSFATQEQLKFPTDDVGMAVGFGSPRSKSLISVPKGSTGGSATGIGADRSRAVRALSSRLLSCAEGPSRRASRFGGGCRGEPLVGPGLESHRSFRSRAGLAAGLAISQTGAEPQGREAMRSWADSYPWPARLGCCRCRTQE